MVGKRDGALDNLGLRSFKHARMPDDATRKRIVANGRPFQQRQHVLGMSTTQKIIDAEFDRRLDRADLAVAVERYHFEIGAGAARADLTGKAGKRIERQADILETDVA